MSFDVSGKTFEIPDRQATILAENLRILSKSDFESQAEPAALLGTSEDWRSGAGSA